MHSIMKSVSKMIFGLFLFVDFALAMEIADLSQAVDVAGKQRMFTQRMLKDYAMVGMKNSFGNPKKDLENIILDFEDHLESLIRFNRDEVTKISLDKVRVLWDPIKKSLEDKPVKKKAGAMQESLEALLGQANEATGLFAKQTGKESGEIINISGRQRMASLYMLKAWGINDPKFIEKMEATMKLFSKSHDRLASYSKNTPETLELLHRAANAFIYFEYMKDTDTHVPALMYKKSMQILKNMNIATGLYAKIGAQRDQIIDTHKKEPCEFSCI